MCEYGRQLESWFVLRLVLLCLVFGLGLTFFNFGYGDFSSLDVLGGMTESPKGTTTTIDFKETTTTTITLPSRRIDNLPSGLDAINRGNNRYELNRDGKRVAEFDLREDADFRDVRADMDLETGRSVVHFDEKSKAKVRDVTLLIPALVGTGRVYICPQAKSLEEVSEDCKGVYYQSVSPRDGFYYVSVSGTGGGEWGDEGEVTVESPVNATWPDTYPTLFLPVNVSLRVGALANYSISVDSDQYSFYDSSLKGFYDFEESLTADHSLSGIDGTIVGTVTNTSGKYGSGARFYGLNGEGIDLGDNFKYADKVSVSAWIQLIGKDYLDSERQVIVSNERNTKGWGFLPYEQRLIFRVANGTSCSIQNSTKLLNYGTWHHVVGTYESGVGGMIYLDGKPLLSEKRCGEINDLVYESGEPGYAQIGRSFHTGTRPLNGSVDNVMIWNRILSDDEVALLYASDLRWINSTYWKLNSTLDVNSTGTVNAGEDVLIDFQACNTAGYCSSKTVYLQGEDDTCPDPTDGNPWTIDRSAYCIYNGLDHTVTTITLSGAGYVTIENSNITYTGIVDERNISWKPPFKWVMTN